MTAWDVLVSVAVLLVPAALVTVVATLLLGTDRRGDRVPRKAAATQHHQQTARDQLGGLGPHA